MTKIAPSILAADPLRMFEAVKLVKDTGCDELHFDVMDGHFVPNISFGPSLLKAIHQEFDLHCDVHLMISDPLKYVENFAASGAGTITIHQEANDFLPCLRKLRELGVRVGASVKPGTSVEALREALPLLDRVLLMTVEPGFGGQKLMPGRGCPRRPSCAPWALPGISRPTAASTARTPSGWRRQGSIRWSWALPFSGRRSRKRWCAGCMPSEKMARMRNVP